jgi:hypothetical protein
MFSINQTVRLVRKIEQEIPKAVKAIQVVESTIYCIEIKESGVTYILASGHHCAEGELCEPVYEWAFLQLLSNVLNKEN